MRTAKEDRRSRRTRRLVTTAMTELLVECPYDEITVQAILDRADIGRATFYQHFRDKLDVVDAIAAEMFEGMAASHDGPPAPGLPAAELFRHAAERYTSLRAMLDTPGADVFWFESHKALAKQLESSLTQSVGRMRQGVPDVAVAEYVAGGFLALLRWWLRGGMPYPPEQMASMAESLIPSITRPAR